MRAVIAVLTAVVLSGAVAFAATGPSGSGVGGAAAAPREVSLTGTWVLRAADEMRADGARVAAYGPDPGGLLIIDEQGRYSLQIFRRERLRFAAGDKRRGTPEEYAAAALGMSSHIGTVVADAVRGTLTFRIELASYPNWDGTVQTRDFELLGDLLSYRIPTAATGNGTTPISVWQRVGR
jgi:hypothetical protein